MKTDEFHDNSTEELQKLIKNCILRANNGEVEAQKTLAAMYLFGDKVEVDLKEAAYWFSKAAEQGDPVALNDGLIALLTRKPYPTYSKINQLLADR